MAKAGRKTKYKREYCKKIIEFFDVEPFEDIELEHYDVKTGKIKWKDIKRMPRKLPTLVQFARSIGVDYTTVYNWQKKGHSSFQKQFFDAYTRAKELQKDFIIQNGLQGLYNSDFTKFVAKNITDMKDKTETEIEGNIEIHIHNH